MPESRAQRAGAHLRAAAEEMLADVARLPAELINWQPAAHVWSVMDILCHVLEFIPYWTAQTLRVVDHPEEMWGRDHTDPDRLAAVTNTSARQLADVQLAIQHAAAESAAALSRLSDSDLDVEARSRNPRWDVRPAHFIIDHLLIEHVEKHLGQIRRNVGQYRERVM